MSLKSIFHLIPPQNTHCLWYKKLFKNEIFIFFGLMIIDPIIKYTLSMMQKLFKNEFFFFLVLLIYIVFNENLYKITMEKKII